MRPFGPLFSSAVMTHKRPEKSANDPLDGNTCGNSFSGVSARVKMENVTTLHG